MASGWRYAGTQGDFNGDGAMDLAGVNGTSSPTVTIALSYGHKLTAQASYIFKDTVCQDAEPCGLFAGDFDGDGRADILVTNLTEDTFPRPNPHSVILRSQGINKWSEPQRLNSVDDADGVADFNGDGRADIVARDGDNLTVYFSIPAERNAASGCPRSTDLEQESHRRRDVDRLHASDRRGIPKHQPAHRAADRPLYQAVGRCRTTGANYLHLLWWALACW